MTLATDDHLRRLPKVELHCHVEGAARASTIADLARKHSVTLPVDDPADLFEFTSLNQFLSIYDVICASLRTADDFRRITYEALEDGAAAGVRYREMFFSPGFVIRLGVPVETVWEGVKAGVLDARQDLDINCRMILDFDKPTGPAHAMEMAAFAGSVPDRDLLVGMGADSVERDIDHAAFAAAFTEAARYGLRRTIHAGEDGPAENIAIAIRELGCERIDHGFRLLDDAALTAEIVERQIPLDVCPTSNVDDRQRRRLGGRSPVCPSARRRRAGDAQLRRPRDDAVRCRRRVRGRRARLRLLAGRHGGHQPGRHRRVLGSR